MVAEEQLIAAEEQLGNSCGEAEPKLRSGCRIDEEQMKNNWGPSVEQLRSM